MTSRLAMFSRVCYERALETFPRQDGTMDLENREYLLSILEVSPEVEVYVILNAINLSHSWAILGEILPQKVMDRIVIAAFRHPQLVPKLNEIAETCPNRFWIFHSVLKMVQQVPDLFRRSIEENSPVWSDFLMDEFAEDFRDKSTFLDRGYDERPFGTLIESVLFSWPIDKVSNVRVGRDLVTAFVKFCLCARTYVGDQLVSYLLPLFPGDVFPMVTRGFADRLNPESLVFCFTYAEEHKITRVEGNRAVMVQKLIHRMPALARTLFSEIDADDPERATIEAMLAHFNSKTKRFTIE